MSTATHRAEKAILAVFTEVLPDNEPVDRETDFFDAGGDSILAARAIARLRTILTTSLSMRDLFIARTPALLATAVAGRIGDLPASRSQ